MDFILNLVVIIFLSHNVRTNLDAVHFYSISQYLINIPDIYVVVTSSLFYNMFELCHDTFDVKKNQLAVTSKFHIIKSFYT